MRSGRRSSHLIAAAVIVCVAMPSCTRDNYIDGNKISQIDEDAVRQSPVGWRSAEIENETHVLLFYETGVEPCYVLGPPDIEYSSDKVTVTLNEGAAPAEGALTCPSVRIGKVVRIELAEPLEGRRIVDGVAKM